MTCPQVQPHQPSSSLPLDLDDRWGHCHNLSYVGVYFANKLYLHQGSGLPATIRMPRNKWGKRVTDQNRPKVSVSTLPIALVTYENCSQLDSDPPSRINQNSGRIASWSQINVVKLRGHLVSHLPWLDIRWVNWEHIHPVQQNLPPWLPWHPSLSALQLQLIFILVV